MESPVSQYEQQFASYLDATSDARELAERDRDYADLKQWTSEEEATLRARGQAPVVFDYIREQVDYFAGVERDARQDPKAFPRTAQHAEAADAVTDAIRYVCDNNDFHNTSSDCFDNLLIEGTEAAIVEVSEKSEGDFEIAIRPIAWDRFYFDPHSRKKDFSDAQFMGIVTWLDESEAKRLYPSKKRAISNHMKGAVTTDGDTYGDCPMWTDGKRKRLRVCEEYSKKDGEWHVSHYSGDLVLIEPKPVGYVDEMGNPTLPIVAQSAYIDRENQRYGYVRRLIDPQNEVNHRRSKALHLLSSRQVIAEEGSVVDELEAKRELKKPDGFVRLTPGSLTNGAIQISQTGDMASGQLAMYQDATQKLQASGANAAMQGDVEGMSGRAIERLQRGGKIQIGPLFDSHRHWKKRLYRQVWYRIKQFWDAERWIRVTDDENNLKWVGLNQPITVEQQLAEAAMAGDTEAEATLQQAMLAGDPELKNVVGTRNDVAEIDVDIILDEAPDTITTQEEQFRMLAELVKVYGPQAVPFKAMVELSSIRGKRRVLEMIEGDDKQKAMTAQMQQMQVQMAQMQAQIAMALDQAKVEKTKAETANIVTDIQATEAKTIQTNMETQLVASVPDLTPNVNI